MEIIKGNEASLLRTIFIIWLVVGLIGGFLSARMLAVPPIDKAEIHRAGLWFMLFLVVWPLMACEYILKSIFKLHFIIGHLVCWGVEKKGKG